VLDISCPYVHQGSSTQQQLAGLAASATLTSSRSSSSIRMPGLAAADMTVDKERHKDKTIYHGTWPCRTPGRSTSDSATLIKVTVSRMYDTTHRRSGCEVAGTSPQLQELLQQLLEHGRLSDAEERQVLQHLSNIVAFAPAAASVMAL
jgi:hypothetical protein